MAAKNTAMGHTGPMADDDTVLDRLGVRDVVAKFYTSDHQVGESQALDADDQIQRDLFDRAGTLPPPYSPKLLNTIYENCGSLTPNVEAYMVNIDGLGHVLQPAIDFDRTESLEVVREAMWVERLRNAERKGETVKNPDALTPGDTEVKTRIEALRRQQRIERVKAETFLAACAPEEGSFIKLRKDTRRELEKTGNAYWEVLRNRRGEVSRFVMIPSELMRVTRADADSTYCDERVPVGLLSTDVVSQPRRFRRYVQIVGNRARFFKAFGDQRVVSRDTGETFKDVGAFERKAKRGDRRATEIIHFKVGVPAAAPYGIPRWIGNLLAVLGSRSADEVNWAYFENKAIPNLAILVSGGQLSKDSAEKIQQHLRDMRGRKAFGGVLVLQASPAAGQGALTHPADVKIAFERLNDLQQGDALFQQYDERNIDKVGSSFRLPRIVRGDTRDFNRATSQSALKYADEQVFDPERQEFDGWFNLRILLSEMNIRLWRIKSRGPRTRDLETVAPIVNESAEAGMLLPNEGRKVLSDVLDEGLPPIDADWARQPLRLTLAGVREQEGDRPAPTDRDDGDEAELRRTRDEARQQLEEDDEVGAKVKQKVARIQGELGLLGAHGDEPDA